jgi:serine/threonine protein kinase, bacterial
MEATEFRGYRILSPLGQGGFGKAFLAEDMQSSTRQQYVIKQFSPQTTDPNTYQIAQDRFQREAAVLLDLSRKHSQLPKLFGYFFHDEGFYLVLEYIQGITLSQKLRSDGPLDPNLVSQILGEVLQTLEVVHGERIVHRDIKPDNIIIRDADQKPVLIDFGAVKDCLMCGQSAATSIVIGSPGFIAPEQAAGRPGYASDIYSLGMTAIYLLTGRSPQELQSHLQSFDLDWQDYALAVPANLATVINKAVQLNPGDRYPSATAMLEALQASSAPTPAQNSAGSPFIPMPNSAELPSTQYSRFNSAPVQQTYDDPATVAVSPPARASDYSSSQASARPQMPAWLLGGLIAGGVVVAGLAGAYVYQQSNQQASLRDTDQVSAPASPQPIPTASPSPSNDLQNADQVSAPASPQPIPTASPSPKDSPSPSNDLITVSEGDAISLLENLYSKLSRKDYTAANALFSPQMAETFDPNFFDQFVRVSVEDLAIRSRTESSLNLIGENTYVYPDGSTQREQRSYTVRAIDGQLVVTASEFIKVLKFR